MEADKRFFPSIQDPQVKAIVEDVMHHVSTKNNWPIRARALAMMALGVTAAIAEAHLAGEDTTAVRLEVLATADYIMDEFSDMWKRPKH